MDAQRPTIDVKRLAAEVSIQHGIRVDPDDPMMAAVTLNRLIFEAALAGVLDQVQTAIRDFDAAAEKVQVRAGAALAQDVRQSQLAMRQEIANMLEEFRRAAPAEHSSARNQRCGERKWLGLGLVVAVVLLAIGVWIGTRLN